MTTVDKLDILVGNVIARLFRKLSDWCENRSHNLMRCECCGENLYWGLPCPQYRTPEHKRIAIERQERSKARMRQILARWRAQ